MSHEKILGIRKSFWALILLSVFVGFSSSTCDYKFYFLTNDSGDSLFICRNAIFYGQAIFYSVSLFIFGIVAHYIVKFNEEG